MAIHLGLDLYVTCEKILFVQHVNEIYSSRGKLQASWKSNGCPQVQFVD